LSLPPDREEGMKAFFTAETKAKVKGAIEAVEAKTAAEIVVTVRERSASYRDVDYLFGFALALASLVGLLFHPLELDERLFPVEVVFAFVLGSVVSAYVFGRYFVPEGRKRAEVVRASRAAFHEQKIAGTKSRLGILLYVSAAERMVSVVVDVGVPEEKLRAEIEASRVALETAVAKGDPTLFVEKMVALGDVLARDLPRTADDVNELPDEVT
jgi:putative membrane protein